MHQLHQLIKTIEKTHKGLGPLIAINILGAKSKRCILNVSPAGCGKSAATNTIYQVLKNISTRYTSLTLASLHRLKGEFNSFNGHLIIDDLGGEKSSWARLSTITVLANIVYDHYVHKMTQTYDIEIENFQGSVAMNVQPVLMNHLVQSDDWIAVVRDKVLRYYHLMRPIKPKQELPKPETNAGGQRVALPPVQHYPQPQSRMLSCLAGDRMGRTILERETAEASWKSLVAIGSHGTNAMVTCTMLGAFTSTVKGMCLARRKRRRQLIRLSRTYQATASDTVREDYYQYLGIRVRQMVRKQRLLCAGRTGKPQTMYNGRNMRRLQNTPDNSKRTDREHAILGKNSRRNTRNNNTNGINKTHSGSDRSQPKMVEGTNN